MKAAKHDPPGEIIVEATVLLDRLLLEADGTQVRATRSPELREIYDRVMPEAVAQYLRMFPKARSNGWTFVQMPHTVEGVHEVDLLCLFCRTSINTLGERAQLTGPIMAGVQRHSDLCGVRFLLGQLEPRGPNNERAAKQRLLAVSKLRGAKLIAEAKAAAEYLGLPEVKARSRGRTVAGGRTGELRKIVAQARRLADQRAREAKDASAAPAGRLSHQPFSSLSTTGKDKSDAQEE